MKIERLVKILELIKKLRGNVDLYDINEFKGKTSLDFKCDFAPYDIAYTHEETKDCENLVNEIYMGENGRPVNTIYCIDWLKDSDIL